ncbi:MAG TPA: sigma-70 family RNA polymerase sigma factor [Gemmatimonadales bacterium]
MTPRRDLDPDAKRAEFEALAVPFMTALFNTALRLTRGSADAADLVQETCLRAYRTYENFQPGTNCKAWLFTIMYSVFINQYRRDQRSPVAMPVEDLERRFHQYLHASGDVAAAETVDAWGGQMSPEVDAALRQLPDDFRAPVLLVDLQGLSYEEAAGALGCPIGTVRSRLFRARRLLFAALRDYAQETGYSRGDP